MAPSSIPKHARVLVTGQATLIGSAIVRALASRGHTELLAGPGREPDWRDAGETERFFAATRPEYVFHADGLTAGIAGNQQRPAELMVDNLLRQVHVIECARTFGVRKLLYLASSCSYPRDCPQPMRPESLFTGPVEPTNDAYAVAKLAGITLCQACRRQYGTLCIVGIPANAFGPGDDFDPEQSHVIPGLIRRFHEAKSRGDASVVIWGTGTPRREFIYVDDLATACLTAMERYDREPPINLGTGTDVSIAELARLVKAVTEYAGEIRFDTSRPDGMPRKLLDSSVLHQLGWRPETDLREALSTTYRWYMEAAPPRLL